ncbi:hypothetical protein BKA62DRAFT_510840 [Auriculariales sp. MPI-PUGE-AT-0066]|nr:hypothetical protein BKA62DRAFT_510840 [Auriculariales sp. MPI-PUGE-AT-0066]
MFFAAATVAAVLATAVSAQFPQTGSASVTPHDSYSSSIGALGCKLDTNRIAYWPAWPSCNPACIKLTHPESGRSRTVLHVDTSGGAYDISYQTWNWLTFGEDATANPQQGGGVNMNYELVGMDQCADILAPGNGRLALSAANSMGYFAGCKSDGGSWAANNMDLYNILNPVCTWGFDEVCSIDLSTGQNQATCPHILGLTSPLDLPVWNVQYGTGQLVRAL